MPCKPAELKRSWSTGMPQISLFASPSNLPEGSAYQGDFLSPAEEQALVRWFSELLFREFEFRAVRKVGGIHKPARLPHAGPVICRRTSPPCLHPLGRCARTSTHLPTSLPPFRGARQHTSPTSWRLRRGVGASPSSR